MPGVPGAEVEWGGTGQRACIGRGLWAAAGFQESTVTPSHVRLPAACVCPALGAKRVPTAVAVATSIFPGALQSSWIAGEVGV